MRQHFRRGFLLPACLAIACGAALAQAQKTVTIRMIDSRTGMLIYANCDADKDRGSSEKAPPQDHWYPVAEILAKGLVAPNDCIGKKVPEKLQVVAKPGEFVFFVRPLNARERFRE